MFYNGSAIDTRRVVYREDQSCHRLNVTRVSGLSLEGQESLNPGSAGVKRCNISMSAGQDGSASWRMTFYPPCTYPGAWQPSSSNHFLWEQGGPQGHFQALSHVGPGRG